MGVKVPSHFLSFKNISELLRQMATQKNFRRKSENLANSSGKDLKIFKPFPYYQAQIKKNEDEKINRFLIFKALKRAVARSN